LLARLALRLERRELAMVLGVSYAVIDSLESGRAARVPERVTAGLRRMGHDFVGFRYRKWREHQAQDILRKVGAVRPRIGSEGDE